MPPLVTSVTDQQTGSDLVKRCPLGTVVTGRSAHQTWGNACDLDPTRDSRRNLPAAFGTSGFCVQIAASHAISDEREAYRYGVQNPTIKRANLGLPAQEPGHFRI
jgi:hypothetical protein